MNINVFMIVYYKCKTIVSVTQFCFHFGSMFLICTKITLDEQPSGNILVVKLVI